MLRIVSQLSGPGVASATPTTNAVANTARSASLSRRRSAVRCQFVTSGGADPGLGHLDAGLALEDVEQDEHAFTAGDRSLEDGDQASPRAIDDAHCRAARQRARGDDAVGVLARPEEVDYHLVQACRLAAEDDQADDARGPGDAVEVTVGCAHEDVTREEG